MPYGVLADIVLVLHLVFVLFVVFGGLLVFRWPGLAWLHVPAAAWGTLIEFSGGICPLTPLENRFRRLGGETGYSGEFIDHYVRALLYPNGLSRGTQLLLGAAVLVLNVTIYWVLIRRLARQSPQPPG